MTEELLDLIARARSITMTSAQLRKQRRSFVYGNTHIENHRITRKIVDEADRKVQEEKRSA